MDEFCVVVECRWELPEAECSDSVTPPDELRQDLYDEPTVTPSDELRQDLYDEPMDPETLKDAAEGLAYGELSKFHPTLIS